MNVAKCVDGINRSKFKAIISCTGGGSQSLGWLLGGGGGSNTLLEAIVPYSKNSFENFLGCRIEKFCSADTARKMAMKSFQKARKYSSENIENIIGLGCCCSLRKDKERKGRKHRVFIGVQTFDYTVTYEMEMGNEIFTRPNQELITAKFILFALAKACFVDVDLLEFKGMYTISRKTVPRVLKNIIHYGGGAVAIDNQGKPISTYIPRVVFPGSFNPIHEGHIEVAKIAYKFLDSTPIDLEVSVSNVDKPPLNYHDIDQRLHFSHIDEVRNLWITNAPTFVEKSRLFPRCCFLVGGDTIERIGKLKYYELNPNKRDEAFGAFEKNKNQFLVFERLINGESKSLQNITIPYRLRKLCHSADEERRFHAGTSSTEIRNK